MKCPICQEEMLKTKLPGIYRCHPQVKWAPEIESEREFIHATCYFNKASNKFEIMILEIEDYEITVWDSEDRKETQIAQLQWEETSKSFERRAEHIITLPQAIQAPWEDAERTVQRIKTLLVFS